MFEDILPLHNKQYDMMQEVAAGWRMRKVNTMTNERRKKPMMRIKTV